MSNPKTIVLVEDEPLIAEMYRRVLSENAYEVLHAMSKQTAQVLIQRHRPAVLLLDLMIPLGAGEELITYDHPVGFDILEWLRHHPELKATKVIIVTNLDSAEHKRQAEKLGADEYLVKANFTPRDIARKVDTILTT